MKGSMLQTNASKKALLLFITSLYLYNEVMSKATVIMLFNSRNQLDALTILGHFFFLFGPSRTRFANETIRAIAIAWVNIFGRFLKIKDHTSTLIIHDY